MIVFIFIAVSTYYIAKANEETLSRVRVVRSGSDIMNVLDRENVFETKRSCCNFKEIGSILPSMYEMRLRINGTFRRRQ